MKSTTLLLKVKPTCWAARDSLAMTNLLPLLLAFSNSALKESCDLTLENLVL
jgi:hypothetical protein